MRKIALWDAYLFLSVAAFFSILLCASACEKTRTPNCFIFPQGFVGWVSVQYKVDGAGELPIKDGCVWIDFRSNHAITTSSSILRGWASDRYAEETDTGLRPIHDGQAEERAVQDHFYQFSGLDENPSRSFEYLFVGTADQIKLNPRSSALNKR